jgi:hypothetical protein
MQRVAQNVQAVKTPSTKLVAYLTSKFSPCFPSSQWWVSHRNTVGSRSSGFYTVYTAHAPDAPSICLLLSLMRTRSHTENHKVNILFQNVFQSIFSRCKLNAVRPYVSKISFENILMPVSLIFFDQYLYTFQVSEMHAACLAKIILLNYSALKILCERNLLRDIL